MRDSRNENYTSCIGCGDSISLEETFLSDQGHACSDTCYGLAIDSADKENSTRNRSNNHSFDRL